MFDHLYKPAAEILFEDLKRHLSPNAIVALAESMRKEEPSGKLSTLSLYLLDAIEAHVLSPEEQDMGFEYHHARCREFGYDLIAV